MIISKPLILLLFSNDRDAILEGILKERQQLSHLLKESVEKWDIEVDTWDYTSIDSFLNALNLKNNRLVLLHFAGHSHSDLLKLDEGTAYAKGLASKLKECPNLKLVFLNGCSNLNLVNALVEAGVPNVIGTRQPVGDSNAQRFSQSFYQALAEQGKSVSKALEQAKSDIELSLQHYRSLDSNEPKNTPDWAWFREGNSPDWRLEEVAHPCNRLPALPNGELPTTPFKNLCYYTEEDAEIFFGRCRSTIEVLEILDSMQEPLLILHGGTGVGKSSFLQAGLIPRLRSPSRNQIVEYYSHSNTASRTNLLDYIFNTTNPEKIRGQLNIINSQNLPQVLIIDQLEEIFIDSEKNQEISKSIEEFFSILHNIFYPIESRPNIKVVFSLRKEWLAEATEFCKNHDIKYKVFFLKNLEKKDIIEVVNSLVEIPYLKKHYKLIIENSSDISLAERIADDLLSDEGSIIAPTLQIILYKLWNRVLNTDEKIWTERIYLDEKKSGSLLDDYLEEQMRKIRDKEYWGKEAVEKGLLLDVLYRHTNSQGFSVKLSKNDYDNLYSHITYRDNLINSLKNNYLITESEVLIKGEKFTFTRVMHDILVKLIRNKYEKSLLIGIRTRKILNFKRDEKNSFLSKKEYKDVKIGKKWCGQLDDVDISIIKKSKLYILKSAIINGFIGILLVPLLVIILIFLFYKNSISLVNLTKKHNELIVNLERGQFDNSNKKLHIQKINEMILLVNSMTFAKESIDYFGWLKLKEALHTSRLYYTINYETSCDQKCINEVNSDYNTIIKNISDLLSKEDFFIKKYPNISNIKSQIDAAKIDYIRSSLMFECLTTHSINKHKLLEIINSLNHKNLKKILTYNESNCVVNKIENLIKDENHGE